MAYFFMVAVQSTKIRAEHHRTQKLADGFMPWVLELVCALGTCFCMLLNFGANIGYVSFVALCFVVYVVLPSKWSYIAEKLIGADVTKRRKPRTEEKRVAFRPGASSQEQSTAAEPLLRRREVRSAGK
jgi:hypothetical protein